MKLEKAKESGEVLTFYSFKGGVGRTMALSNIAFLAAHSGLRVLVMDWDLEAPGMAYYFRGIVDTPILSKAKETPGVLNVLWDWINRLKAADSKKKLDQLSSAFNEGDIFRQYTVTLLDGRQLPSGGCLDHIGTGSSTKVNAPEPTSYENALAQFPWHDFFTKLAGGFVVQSLRNWAKKDYDLVLIDSRTGLAEAAGVCTMQLADSVAMCFVMNRQNIDGIARVSKAIRQARGNEVALYAVPMRVAREGTAEESEARARAASELNKVGGFSVEELQHQLQVLSVKQAENVPFFEAISLVIAEDPELDPLTLNYARLAKELVGKPISISPIDEGWLKVIRARLKPGFATKEFIEKLLTAEPLRGIEEFKRLLAGYQEYVSEGNDIDKEYVHALTKASLKFSSGSYGFESHELRESCLDLLRMLFRRDNAWRDALIDAIDQYLAVSMIFDEDAAEEVALFEEIDKLLALDASIEAKLRRVGLKRRAAQLFGQIGEYEIALQENAEGIGKLVESCSPPILLTMEQKAEASALKVLLSLQRGTFLEQTNAFDDALDNYFECLSLAERNCEVNVEAGEFNEIAAAVAEAHARVALIKTERIATNSRCEHALLSVQIPGAMHPNFRFFELTDLLKSDPGGPERLFAFLELSFESGINERPGGKFAGFSRSPRTVMLLSEFIRWFVTRYEAGSDSRLLRITNRLLDIFYTSLLQISRRLPVFQNRSIRMSSPVLDLVEEFYNLINCLILKNIEWANKTDAINLVQSIQHRATAKK
ncbi:hypothetical protein [Delftia sp.]|uniref:KGGVGR-motif variant AAA ATPase n=1 Tax=Delftia sp. TaxID=1886637 RepID=UPI00259CB73C|nr:hypothetical protein [Delftia sp.]